MWNRLKSVKVLLIRHCINNFFYCQVVQQTLPSDAVQEQQGGHRLSTVEVPPLNLMELQQKLAQQNLPTVKEQHKVSTTSLPPIPTFETQQADHRRLSTISQPASVQDYIQNVQVQLPEIQGQDFTSQVHLNQVRFFQI